MLELAKIECVGCTACASICPNGTIQMCRNLEGFQEPYITDENTCIQCGLCEKACPVLNVESDAKHTEKAFIVQNLDDDVRKESASGGMFSAIATFVFQNDGIVYGAAYDETFTVRHIRIESPDDLWRLRNSKYVQSNLDDVFSLVEADLITGRQVCFSGTPCQVEGLKRYLRKDYENLVLVDIVCHGVSSPLIWEKYLQTIQCFNPSNIYFRWKHYGYKYSTMSIFDKNNNEVYFSGVESDKMLRAYFTNNCDRECCYKCKFKKRYRISDFTIWDCFQPRYFNKDFDDDMGTSCVLINTARGQTLFEQILSLCLLRSFEVDPDELTYGNKEMVSSVKRGEHRNTILCDAANMDANALFAKYFPESAISKLKKNIRLLLVKTGLYNFFKYQLFLYRRKKSNRNRTR